MPHKSRYSRVNISTLPIIVDHVYTSGGHLYLDSASVRQKYWLQEALDDFSRKFLRFFANFRQWLAALSLAIHLLRDED